MTTDNGQVSDGYHTFDELYEHRNLLMLQLMAALPRSLAWFSLKHDDGSMFEAMFVAGVELPNGTITYHMPISLIELARNTWAKELEKAPPYDGHTSSHVIARLKSHLKCYE